MACAASIEINGSSPPQIIDFLLLLLTVILLIIVLFLIGPRCLLSCCLHSITVLLFGPPKTQESGKVS